MEGRVGQADSLLEVVLKTGAVLWLVCANCDREAKADLGAIIVQGWVRCRSPI
jgi:hypothetical protein